MEKTDNKAEFALLMLVAAFLAFPVAMPSVLNYETNPAFLLAPILPFALIRKWDSISLWFIAAGVLGLCAISIAGVLYPDGRMFRNFLSLVLLMFPAGFYFVGRELRAPKLALRVFALLSSVFLISVSLPLLWGGEPVRVQNADDYSVLNLHLLGFPIFASFGVNALAQMIALQFGLVVGALLGSRDNAASIVLLAGAFAGGFLVFGSDSRSAIIYFAVIFLAMLFYGVWMGGQYLARAGLAAIVIVAGIFVSYLHAPFDHRVAQFITRIVTTETPGTTPAPAPKEKPKYKWDDAFETPEIEAANRVSSGRLAVAALAVREFLSSPIIGTGFSPFGRYEPPPSGILLSSGTHVYYLTALWKGGLLFAVPFFTFLAMIAWRAVHAGQWRSSPEAAIAFISTIGLFCFVSLTYDTPNVPSVGALAFLLVGLLGRERTA